MFTLDQMYQFRNGTDMSKVDEEVKKGWYVFCSDFCKWVSPAWRKALTSITGEHKLQFQKLLTRSDEALVMWIIYCKWDVIKSNVDAGKYLYTDKKATKDEEEPANEKEKKKRSGPQDSKIHILKFIEMTEEVGKLRNNRESAKAWQKYFFDAFEKSLKSQTNHPLYQLPCDDSENDGMSDSDDDEDDKIANQLVNGNELPENGCTTVKSEHDETKGQGNTDEEIDSDDGLVKE
jgi:hypothetical protein